MNITISKRTALIAVAVILLVFYFVGGFIADKFHAKEQEVVVLTKQQAESAEQLKKVTDGSERQAKELRDELARVKEEKRQPIYVTEYVERDTNKAAAEIAKNIEDTGKISPDEPMKLPAADKTLVVPVPEKQTVEVYRITLDKARWGVNALVLAGGDKRPEVGLGPSWKNRDNAVNLGYTTEQRGYLMAVHYF